MVSCVYQYQQSGKGQTSKSRRETGKEKTEMRQRIEQKRKKSKIDFTLFSRLQALFCMRHGSITVDHGFECRDPSDLPFQH